MMLPSLAPEASASADFATAAYITNKPESHAPSTNPENGAEDRNRTGTIVTNPGILSPVRLPVSPPRPVNFTMERVMGIGPT